MQIDTNWVRDTTIDSFEEALAERSDVPEMVREQVAQWPDDKLDSHSQAVVRLLRRFAEEVAREVADSASPDTFLSTFDLQYISRDHDWRAVFSALRNQGAGHRRHKMVAMRKYMQYLAARRDLIEKVVADRDKLSETRNHNDPTLTGDLDATVVEGLPGGASITLKRLPNGESVEIELPAHRSVRMRLGKHPFSLVGGVPQLIDNNQNAYPFHRGRQSVGRHAECQVHIDANFSQVSRVHMLVEWRGENVISIMDVSSLGTHIEADAILGD